MSKVYKRRSGIMAAKLKEETVMMDVMSGKYYNLGEVGGRIWEILEQPMDKAALVDKLIQEYDISREQCEIDITPFMNQLFDLKLLEEV